MDDGKLYSTSRRWVVGVSLSAKLVMVVRDRTEEYVSTRLLHELLGYLKACGCELILLDFRCPLAWRHGGSFKSVRGLPKVDLALADLVLTHLKPFGYRLQAATLARLL